MSIELQPLGVKCNIGCSYCYQTPMRDISNGPKQYNMTAMKRAAEAEGVGQPDGKGNNTGFTIFGGEPLLLPLSDLEDLMRWGAEKGAAPGIQTNATLITDRHIELFKTYRTGVGVSMDGPGDLNRTRTAKDGKDTTTDVLTAKSQANLERLLSEGISTSLIVTVSAGNAGTDEQLDRLIAWLLDLRDRGLKYVNLHTLEVDTAEATTLLLTTDRATSVMRRMRRELTGFVQVSPFADMEKSLLREPGSNCVWSACDPLTTSAVRGIDGQGGRKNCGRTEKQGVSFMKADIAGKERSLVLYLTPQEHGGCSGCRFFAACAGHCPGEAIDGDWRNRSIHCGLLMKLFEDIEADCIAKGQTPFSASPNRASVEAALINGWMGRAPASFSGNVPHGDRPHGDHDDAVRPVITHGDSHGDSGK